MVWGSGRWGERQGKSERERERESEKERERERERERKVGHNDKYCQT